MTLRSRVLTGVMVVAAFASLAWGRGRLRSAPRILGSKDISAFWAERHTRTPCCSTDPSCLALSLWSRLRLILLPKVRYRRIEHEEQPVCLHGDFARRHVHHCRPDGLRGLVQLRLAADPTGLRPRFNRPRPGGMGPAVLHPQLPVAAHGGGSRISHDSTSYHAFRIGISYAAPGGYVT